MKSKTNNSRARQRKDNRLTTGDGVHAAPANSSPECSTPGQLKAGSNPASSTKSKRKPKRVVFGRLRGIEVPGRDRVMQFELTKAGVVCRERCTRKASATVLGFERMANGGGLSFQVGEATYYAALTPGGVEVRRKGGKPAVVKWEVLVNESDTNGQPYLWPDLCRYGPEQVAPLEKGKVAA